MYAVYLMCVGACFSRVHPTPLNGPRLVACSQSALDLLGLSPDQVMCLPYSPQYMYIIMSVV